MDHDCVFVTTIMDNRLVLDHKVVASWNLYKCYNWIAELALFKCSLEPRKSRVKVVDKLVSAVWLKFLVVFLYAYQQMENGRV